MPGSGTNNKLRPQTHSVGPYRPEGYRWGQDSYGDHYTTKQESYRNYRNQDSYHYTPAVPRNLLIETQTSHNPPRYANVEIKTFQQKQDSSQTVFQEAYKPNLHPYRNERGFVQHADHYAQEPRYDHYHHHMHQDPFRHPHRRSSREHPSAILDPQRPHCPNPPRAIVIDTQPSHGHPRTSGLIPSSGCGSCSWESCRTLVCCVLTCGFYSRQQPCIPANESSTDPPAKSEPEPRQLEARSESKGTNLPCSGSFRYGDVYFKGKKVNYPANSEPPHKRKTMTNGDLQRPVSDTSTYLDVDEVDDGGTDIDSLITKKLLELYKLHQIEQLAKCTSDQSFSQKTNEISDLINSIAQDYNLEEQEAECRLVHGVIRISTRKYKSQSSRGYKSKDYKSQDALLPPNRRRDGTLPDSGNETMTFTFSNDEPDMLVSDLTSSDDLARRMRTSKVYSSGTATTTDSSGEPLLC